MQNKRNNLHKRLMDASSAEDVVRNHAYSRVASRSGAVPVRRAPARGNIVPGYRDSMVGSIAQYKTSLPIQPAPQKDTGLGVASPNPILGNRPASGTVRGGGTGTGPTGGGHHFVEPPKRNFNRFD